MGKFKILKDRDEEFAYRVYGNQFGQWLEIRHLERGQYLSKRGIRETIGFWAIDIKAMALELIRQADTRRFLIEKTNVGSFGNLENL